MRKIGISIIALLALGTSCLTNAASFDCSKAQDATEKEFCSNPQVVKEHNKLVKEIEENGLKPTDENIYNLCFASSLLLINAANNALDGLFNGDKFLGDVLLISHSEYREIVKGLAKDDSAIEIKKDSQYFDKIFQMRCRAEPDKYIRHYSSIFRLKLTEDDLKKQW